MATADDLLRRLKGGKKPKGLPKRHRNNVRQARRLRSLAKLPEKKLRHVLKRNGHPAALKYVNDGFAQMAVLRKLEAQHVS